MLLNHAIDTRKKKSAISAILEEIKNVNVAQPPFEVHEGGVGGGGNPWVCLSQGERLLFFKCYVD